METYKCIKNFDLPFFDEDGNKINGLHKVTNNTVWEYEHDYTSTSDARLYLKDGNSDIEYIDITFERMEQCFVRVA